MSCQDRTGDQEVSIYTHECRLRISVNESENRTAVAQVRGVAHHFRAGGSGCYVPLQSGIEIVGFDRLGHCGRLTGK